MATSSAIGDGAIAYQVGPQAGRASAPLEVRQVFGRQPRPMPVLRKDRGSISHTPCGNALAADDAYVYIPLNPDDQVGGGSAKIVRVTQRGGRERVLWSGGGVVTSVVLAGKGPAVTADYGTGEAVYLSEGGGLARLTARGMFPSHASYGAGYLTWWSAHPCVFQVGSDRIYRVPGRPPELFGNLLVFLTPQGLRWMRLPNS